MGFQWGTADDPEGAAIAVAIWYPSDAKTNEDAGPFPQHVAHDGPILGSHLPLIILSHGTGGTPLNYYDTAIAIAEAGFVVAGPVHTGDNYQDHSVAFSERNFSGRPRQVSRVIDYMLGPWASHAAIDAGRIGILGHSAGGTTAFLAIGGQLSPARLMQFCRDNPDDWGCRQGRLHSTAGAWNETGPPIGGHDPRIKAAVLAAPALAYAYLPGGENIPAQLWVGGRDAIVTDAALARPMLSGPTDYHPVEKAGHFAYLAPCSDMLAAIAPDICTDPDGFDRPAFLRGFQNSVISFFRAHL